MVNQCLQIPMVAIGMNEKLYPYIQQIENGEDDENASQKLLVHLQKLLVSWPDPAELHEVELLSPSSTNGLLDIINNIDKLSPELPEYLKNENRLAFYNIICLFDNTFPYM
ncbi:14087_t:CDS:2 [Entrophospora sp. SA101]|nr:14087_t:CDS:2 [Entrophospora sp. SA101]CAJ0911865.1 7854_t:CDS:2 [Entrophospora sp. SA101]